MKTRRPLPLWQSALTAAVLTGLLLGVLVYIFSIIQAQADTAPRATVRSSVVYRYPADYTAPPNRYYTYLIDTTGRATIHDVIRDQKAGLFSVWQSDGTTFNLGMKCLDVWLHIDVRNQSAQDISLIWQLENAIDSAQLYISRGDGVSTHRNVSFYTPLAQRTLPVRALFDTIWLGPGDERELYYHVYRNHYNTNIPMTLLPLPEFLKHENRNNSIYTAYISVFLFIIIFNFFLFISLRDPIHLWYSMFIFCISMFLLIDAYYHVLIFPDFLYRICARTEPLPFVNWTMVGSGMVMQLLLGHRRSNSYLFLPFRILLVLLFALGAAQLIVCSLSLLGVGTYPFYFFHTVSNILVLASLCVGVTCVVEKVLQREPIAIIYFWTTMLPIFGILNSYLNCIGFTSFSFMFPTAIALGIMIEIIVLTMLLTLRYNLLQKEKNQLLAQQLQMQIELGDRIAETQENEQKRIAEDLHDGIGSMLTALHLMVNKGIDHLKGRGQAEASGILTDIRYHIDRLAADVRTISHDLMPKDFEQNQFSEIIKNHMAMINAASSVQVEYYLDPEINQLSKGLQINVFRIFTELLNNSLKHSQAANITAQFIIHNHILMLMIDDEGIGFSTREASSGIGLKNIHSRVKYLRGSISFDSSPKGTIIIAEIPIS